MYQTIRIELTLAGDSKDTVLSDISISFNRPLQPDSEENKPPDRASHKKPRLADYDFEWDFGDE